MPAEDDTLERDGGITALVLPGGGARGAYQAGVLRAIAERVADESNPDRNPNHNPMRNPFAVITGVSAGAVNAASLASHADEFQHGVDRLEKFWASMHCSRIYRTDVFSVLRTAVQWGVSLPLGGRLVPNPRSLLDNEPLREFLESTMQLDGIERSIDNGALRGVAITASGYTCASAVSFYQAAVEVEPWERARRFGQRDRLTFSHILASAALPLIFPAERIGNEFFGDGGMRTITPLSPAIHLGADRLLVISTRDERPDARPDAPMPYPSLGEIGGYLLDTIFMDTLNADLNRLNRINRTLSLMDPERRAETGLKNIESLVIRPSRDLRDLTREHAREIPWAVRTLLKTLGGWGRDWRLASYLLFEAPYCQALIDLGYRDACEREDELREFLAPRSAPRP